MSVLGRLSSVAGDRSEASNKAVARDALQRPELLEEVAVGLEMADRRLAGDCAEVMCEVAKENPALVLPYLDRLVPLTAHRDTRCRWESMHAVALLAALAPAQVAPLVPDWADKLERDRSVIVRDSAVKALGGYGQTGAEAAREVWPHLRRAALEVWGRKHAGLALEAMLKLVEVEPGLKAETRAVAEACLDHRQAKVRRLAKKLLAAVEKATDP